MMVKKSAKGQRPAHLLVYADQQVSATDDAIRKALREIEEDPSLPATQEKVAELAECSRGTFINRRKPGPGPDGKIVKDPHGFHAWLKRIRDSRQTSNSAQEGAPQAAEDPKTRLEELKHQLEAARSETKRQFDLRLTVERKLEKLTSSSERLAKAYALQSELVAQLNEKLAALGASAGSVVMFRTGEPP